MPIYKDTTNNTYYASICYTDWMGEQKRKIKRGFKLRREAVAYEADFLANLSDDCRKPFEVVANEFLDTCDRKGRKENTMYTRRAVVAKHIIPYFGSRPICEITPPIVYHWQTHLAEDEAQYAPTYLYNINGLLGRIFTFAQKLYGLKNNPVKQLDSLGKARNEHFDYWTQEQFQIFLEGIADEKASRSAQIKRFCDTKALIVAYKILFYMGLRIGELLALTIDDYKVDKKELVINKSYKRLKGKDIISTPKTPNSNRVLRMPDIVIEALDEHINRIPYPTGDTRIFNFISTDNVRRALKSEAKRLGLPVIRLHDLRHSCCSLLFSLGCQPLEVKNYLGHKNIFITLNIYAHLYPDQLSGVTDRINFASKTVSKSYQPENEKSPDHYI